MAKTLWFEHGSHRWHVEEGSAAHKNLLKENATLVDGPEEAAPKKASRKKTEKPEGEQGADGNEGGDAE